MVVVVGGRPAVGGSSDRWMTEMGNGGKSMAGISMAGRIFGEKILAEIAGRQWREMKFGERFGEKRTTNNKPNSEQVDT